MLIDHHVAISESIPGPLASPVHKKENTLSRLGLGLPLPGRLEAPLGQGSFPHRTESSPMSGTMPSPSD